MSQNVFTSRVQNYSDSAFGKFTATQITIFFIPSSCKQEHVSMFKKYNECDLVCGVLKWVWKIWETFAKKITHFQYHQHSSFTPFNPYNHCDNRHVAHNVRGKGIASALCSVQGALTWGGGKQLTQALYNESNSFEVVSFKFNGIFTKSSSNIFNSCKVFAS